MKFLIIFLLVALHVSSLFTQNNIFNLPDNIPQPEWYTKINWHQPNIFEIDEMITVSRNEEDAVVYDGDEEEFEEDPYLTAYIRWRMQNELFIQPDGSIKIDPTAAKQQAINEINNNKNRQLTTRSAGTWTPLGPMETYGNGALSNSLVNIYIIAIAPSDPNILFAGTETGAVFKSVDKGLNWKCVSDDLTTYTAGDIAVDPTDPNIVYWGTGATGVFFKTVDGGDTWSLLESFPSTTSNRIIINPISGRIITANTNGKIYYSDDKGITWNVSGGIQTGNSAFYDLAQNPYDLNVFYAIQKDATSSKPIMFRSKDNGKTFSAVTTPDIEISSARMTVSPKDPAIIFCITLGTGGTTPALFKSIDTGYTYTLVAQFVGTNLTGTNAVNGMSNGQGYYDLAILANPMDADQVIVGTTTAYRSTDGGVNFYPLGGYIGNFGLHPDIQSIRAQGNDCYITTDGGISYSTDFFEDVANFSVRNNGINGSSYWGFGQGWVEDVVVGGRYHNGNAALYSGYPAQKAIALGGGEDATGHVFNSPGRYLDVGFRDIGTRTIPTDITKNAIKNPFTNTKWPQTEGYGLFSSKLMQHPNYSNIFYLGLDSILWKTENKGTSYIPLNKFGGKVYRFDISRSDPSIIYACASNNIYKTNDGGVSWSILSLPSGVFYSYNNADIAVDANNPNIVWFSQGNGAFGNKVFKSIDGGITWNNYGGDILNNEKISFIVPQAGSDGGVYAFKQSYPGKVYYRDNTLADWVDFSNGIPKNMMPRQGGQIFYGKDKLRIAGNRGVYESPLYQPSLPIANPMTNSKEYYCTRDTVYFGDYSVLNYSGAKFQWQFPGATYVSSTTTREPKVLYGQPGSYDVTLTVTNSQNQSSTVTIPNMIIIGRDNCIADTLIGKSLVVPGTGRETTNIGLANINSNSFSISCWIQPYGLQNSFSQLIAHDPCPGSPKGFGLGFMFLGYIPNLRLCYTDQMVGYSNSSNLYVDTNRWNFVVLTYSPTGVKIYLNGVGQSVNNNSMPVLDLSQTPFYVNKDIHGQGGDYRGEIDEIKIYNYVLSEQEIREKMHIIQHAPMDEIGLVSYVQFNKYNENNGDVYELKRPSLISLPRGLNSLVTSTAPVATGVAETKTNINSFGPYLFSKTGIEMEWPNSATVPNGDLVTFRLNSNPDQIPDTNYTTVPLKSYYIINNFGSNQTFSSLKYLRIKNLPIPETGYSENSFSLYKRGSTDFGDTWGSNLGPPLLFSYGADSTSYLDFESPELINFGQILINNSDAPISKVTPEQGKNGNQNNVVFWPQPANDILNLSINTEKDTNLNFIMLNAEGAIVERGIVKSNIKTYQINTRELKSGVYFLQFFKNNQPLSMYKVTVIH